jgi:alpha-beta hydrolase superfamily lysophospholipase
MTRSWPAVLALAASDLLTWMRAVSPAPAGGKNGSRPGQVSGSLADQVIRSACDPPDAREAGQALQRGHPDPGAIHDVFLSQPAARRQAFDELSNWLTAYAPDPDLALS